MKEKQCRQITTERAGGRCERCGNAGATTLHHRKKRSQGGLWDPRNCVQVCGHGTTGCHGWIEDHPEAAWETGWHVRPWEDPAVKPVLIAGSFAYLQEDGTIKW